MNLSAKMRSAALALAGLSAALIILQNCGGDALAPSDKSVVTGRVVNSSTHRPISGVLVRSFSFAATDVSDENGEYELEVALGDTASNLVTLAFSKEGYEEASIVVSIQNGQHTQVPDAEMVQSGGSLSGASDDAANVVLISVQTSSVFVKGSGANETSNLTFEVRDANGIPIDVDHQVKVCFSIISGPNAGEFVNPDSVNTSADGRAVTTLNSGTVAGTVQIVAEVFGTTIQSDPIPITIHGWLPDAAHFAIARNRTNFAGYNRVNLRNAITVLVGDRFSNPVPPGTAVWFSTTGGVIQGSATTDNDGLASVDLISGSPQPQGINFGALKVINPATLPSYFNEPGYALVTAQTIDENNKRIYAETVVLFSGIATVHSLSDNTFDLPPDGFKDFTFIVSDQNRNPLAPGTIITVSTNNGSVTGDINITLADNLLRDATNFQFRLSNSKPNEIEGESTTVTIAVSGPNGVDKLDFFGFMRRI